MQQKQKISLIIGIGVALFIAGIVVYLVASGGNSTNSGSDDGNSTMFIIMVSQIPIWISLAAAKREKRKNKESEGRKSKEKNLYISDSDYYEDKALSAYDGEIVGYDELEEKNSLYNS